MSRIISISREYGSGGHEVAMRAAKTLGIPCLDKQLMELAMKTSGLSKKILEKAEEKVKNPFLYTSVYEGDDLKLYGMDRKKVEAIVRKVDRQRKSYYEYHTGKDWGLPSNYDACLNTAVVGIERSSDLIVESFEKMKEGV